MHKNKYFGWNKTWTCHEPKTSMCGVCVENIFLCKYKHKEPQWRRIFLSSSNLSIICQLFQKLKLNTAIAAASEALYRCTETSPPGPCFMSWRVQVKSECTSCSCLSVCVTVNLSERHSAIISRLRFGSQNQKGKKEIGPDAVCVRFFSVGNLFVLNVTNLTWSDGKQPRPGRSGFCFNGCFLYMTSHIVCAGLLSEPPALYSGSRNH